MDILTLGLGAVKANQEDSPEAAAPGFDAALNEAQISSGGIPPGGPPGPEPPPGIAPAGEGVTSNEPNALSKELDFLPQADLNIEIPEALLASGNPGIKADADTDTEATSKDSDLAPEALEWMASQMTGGFFATPIVSVAAEVATVANKTEIAPMAVVQVSGSSDKVFGSQDNGQKPKLGDPTLNRQYDPTLNRKPDETLPVCPVPDVPRPPDDVCPEGPASQDVNDEAPVEIILTVPNQPTKPGQQSLLSQDGQKLLNIQSVTSDEVRYDVARDQIAVVNQDDVASMGQKTKPNKTSSDETPQTTQVDRSALGEKVERTGAKPRLQNGEKDKSEVKGPDMVPIPKPSPQSSDTGSKSDENLKKGSKEMNGIFPTDKPVENVELGEEKPVFTVTDQTGVAPAEIAESGIQTVGTNKSTEVAKDEPKLAAGEVSSVVKQVSDRLHMLAAARPKQGVTIHLSPEDFGNITVVVKSIGQQVEAQLFASDERVREALDQNHSRLTEAMDRRGYQLQAVTVSSQTNHSTHQDAPKQQAQSNDPQSSSQDRPSQSHGHGGHKGQAQEFNDRPVRASAWAQKKEGVDLSI